MFEDLNDLKTQTKRIRKDQFPENAVNESKRLMAKSTNKNDKNLYLEKYTICSHTLDVVKRSTEIINNLPIENSFKEILLTTTIISAIFHDLGKSAAGFQSMILNRNVRKWPENEGGNRHEVLSSILAFFNLKHIETLSINQSLNVNEKKCSIKCGNSIREIIDFAILTHHKEFEEEFNKSRNYHPGIPSHQWPFNEYLECMYEEVIINKKRLEIEWKHIYSELSSNEYYRKIKDSSLIKKQLFIPSWCKIKKELDLEKWLPRGYKNGLYKKREVLIINEFYRLIQALTRGILISSDHLASGVIDPINKVNLSVYPIFKDSKKKPHEFQNRCAVNESILLRAPTGSGKTEAAWLWMQKIFKNSNNEHFGCVYYVLPFRASLNAMFRRFMGWLSFDLTNFLKIPIGVQHSKAQLLLYSILEELDDKIYLDENDSRSIFSISKSLDKLTNEVYYPIKVSTPHQMLKSIFQGKGWESVLTDYFKATIVFDEIHAYDPHFVGLVLGMSKVLINEPFNCKILFMSATFPEFLVDLIKENVFENKKINFITPNRNFINDRKILDLKRHNLKIIKKNLLSFFSNETEYLKVIGNAKLILIICNIVENAQFVYLNLKQIFRNIKLYHSRFKSGDRNNREDEINEILKEQKESNEVFILVATQVVEVSLDIDFEICITEGAPLDALIQRFGRVNRKGTRKVSKGNPNIFITKPSKKSIYVYDKELTDFSISLLKQNEGKLLSEDNLVRLVNILYKKYPWDDIQFRKFENAFNHPLIEKFPKDIIPGTSKYWVEHVLNENVDNYEALLEEDTPIFEELVRIAPIEAIKMQLPVRSAFNKFKFKKGRIHYPPILKKEYYKFYSKEIGLVTSQKINDLFLE